MTAPLSPHEPPKAHTLPRPWVGKIFALFTVLCAVIVGGAIYYLQVYAFYYDVTDKVTQVTLRHVTTGELERFPVSNVEAIDADSSPRRFRACFRLPVGLDDIRETYTVYPQRPEPSHAPSWFECFNAEALGKDLETGQAVAFLETKDIYYGLDRLIAVYPDATAYMWHQINECGEQVFHGKPAPDHCPTPPERLN